MVLNLLYLYGAREGQGMQTEPVLNLHKFAAEMALSDKLQIHISDNRQRRGKRIIF